MNFVLFQTKLKRSSIDKKILLVEGAKATLEEEAEIIGEMYVSIFTCHKYLYISSQVLKSDVINLLHTFVFGKSPTK